MPESPLRPRGAPFLSDSNFGGCEDDCSMLILRLRRIRGAGGWPWGLKARSETVYFTFFRSAIDWSGGLLFYDLICRGEVGDPNSPRRKSQDVIPRPA